MLIVKFLLELIPEPTARSAIPGVSLRRGLLIPHGYLHPGKSRFKSGFHRTVGGHLTDLKNMDVYQEWKRQKKRKLKIVSQIMMQSIFLKK